MARSTGYGFQFGDQGSSAPPNGGVIGAVPFAIRSADGLPAIFTSLAARDTYYTVTAPEDLLATPLGDGAEAVGTGANDGNPVGITAAFKRNEANDDWVPVATNFTGRRDPQA